MHNKRYYIWKRNNLNERIQKKNIFSNKLINTHILKNNKKNYLNFILLF